jgi:hypothetical protein
VVEVDGLLIAKCFSHRSYYKLRYFRIEAELT